MGDREGDWVNIAQYCKASGSTGLQHAALRKSTLLHTVPMINPDLLNAVSLQTCSFESITVSNMSTIRVYDDQKQVQTRTSDSRVMQQTGFVNILHN